MNKRFRNTMDNIFAKIFPAAAEAARDDHGGFNFGDLLVLVLDLVLLIYTGYRSWHFLSGSVADEFQIMALVGLWGLDIGAVFWSLTWIFGSTTKFQNWTSMGMFVVDIIGVFLTSIVDTLAYGNGVDTMPAIIKTMTWFGIPIIIGLNVLAGFIYHMTSPDTRRRRAIREMDEEMAQQKEKGDLELRRMNMQLYQAQEYTQKRAEMLVAFAGIAEQNQAMKQIEDQMMAKLNTLGGLDNMLTGSGLAPTPLTTKPAAPSVNDLIQKVKNQIGLNGTTEESNTQEAESQQRPGAPWMSPQGMGVMTPLRKNGHKPEEGDPRSP